LLYTIVQEESKICNNIREANDKLMSFFLSMSHTNNDLYF